MYSSEFYIYCICETWLSDFVYDHEILPINFTIYRKDRPSRGGGIFVAVSNVFDSVHLSSPADLEIVTIQFGCCRDLVLCTSYVPPNSSDTYLLALLNYFTDLLSTFHHCIFVGDFNFPDIDWSSLTASSSHSNIFCEFVFDSNLIQHVNSLTLIRGNILDLVLTTSSLIIDKVVTQSPPKLLSSDRFVINFTLTCNVSASARYKPRYVLDNTKADYHGMCSYLLDVDFSFSVFRVLYKIIYL